MKEKGGDRIYKWLCVILNTWLSYMSTSFRPEIIIIVFQQVSNVVWVEWGWKKNPLVFIFILVKWRDIIIITYPWGEHSFKWEWPFFFFFNWAIAMATGNSFNREWDRREGKEKKGYQSIYNMYMVTINSLFYMSIEEIWIYAYLKLNIIYRDRNNGGSQNRCRVKEKRVNCMLS
jgi:hypothetical protein